MDSRLIDRFRNGDRHALARLLSHVARGEGLAEISTALRNSAQPSRVVAFTGSGGVGKSSLIGKLIEQARGENQTVAVLACDPESPVTGGALLGDRFRMGSRPDDGIFIRSLAAPGGRGAVAEHLPLMIRLLESFGFGLILLETVGAGQGDVTVRQFADVVVLLLQPEAGDDIQWEKAGVLEVADLIAVNKGDLPGAEQTAAQVQASLGLSHGAVPVILVSSKTGRGVDELWRALHEAPSRRGKASEQDILRAAQSLLAERFRAALRTSGSALRELLEHRQQGEMSDNEVADKVLRLLADQPHV